MSEHIGCIVNGFSDDLLAHSPSKSFVNRCETRLRLLLLFLVCSLSNFVSLKAHQGLITGTYTAEFDYGVVGTLAAARYNETDILYNLPDRIGNIYPDRFAKEAMSVVDDARRIRSGLIASMARASSRSVSPRARVWSVTTGYAVSES